MGFIRFIIIALFSFTFFSCVQTRNVTVDSLEPASVKLPDDVNHLSVLARNFKYSNDTLQGTMMRNTMLKDAPVNENRVIDSLAVASAFHGLKNQLIESGTFSETRFFPYYTIRPHYGDHVIPLSNSLVEKVCEENKSDALIVLEMISYFYGVEEREKSDLEGDWSQVKINAIWSVYLPGVDKPYYDYSYSDTLYWTQLDENGFIDYNMKIPGRVEAVAKASEVSGEKFGNRFTPNWQKASRTFITLKGDQWKRAEGLALSNQWEEAEAIWEPMMRDRNKKVSGAASHNVALASEMKGDLEKALFYSEQAQLRLKSGDLKNIVRAYYQLLKKREITINELNAYYK